MQAYYKLSHLIIKKILHNSKDIIKEILFLYNDKVISAQESVNC